MTMASTTISEAQKDQDIMYKKQIAEERKAQEEGKSVSIIHLFQ